MKIRRVQQQEIHRDFFSLLKAISYADIQQKWMYVLRWGIEHALRAGEREDTQDVLYDLSFIHAYDTLYSATNLSLYWRCVDKKNRGEGYRETLQKYLQQAPSRCLVEELESIVNLCLQAKWNVQGKQYIDSLLLWLEPYQKREKQSIFRLQNKRNQFLLAEGKVQETLERYVDNLSSVRSTEATLTKRWVQLMKDSFSKGRSIPSKEAKEIYHDVVSLLSIEDMKRFDLECMMLSHVCTTTEELLAQLYILQERLPLIKSTSQQIDVHSQRALDLECQIFRVFFQAKEYDKAIEYGQKLLCRLHEMEVSKQIEIQGQLGRCYVQVQDLSQAFRCYERLKEHFLFRMEEDRHLLFEWYCFSFALGQAYSRQFFKDKSWDEALQWAHVEVEAREKFVLYLTSHATDLQIPMNPNEINAYGISVYQRANIYKHTKQHQEAEKDYVLSIQILQDAVSYGKSIFSKNLALSWHSLGLLYELEKKNTDAVHAFRQALNIRTALRTKRDDMEELWQSSALKVSKIMTKMHQGMDTPENRQVLQYLLALRIEITEQSQKVEHEYAVVLILNTLALWALNKEEWDEAYVFLEDMHRRMTRLCHAHPEKDIYTKGLYKVTVRFAFCMTHHKHEEAIRSFLQENEISFPDKGLMEHIRNLFSSL